MHYKKYMIIVILFTVLSSSNFPQTRPKVVWEIHLCHSGDKMQNKDPDDHQTSRYIFVEEALIES